MLRSSGQADQSAAPAVETGEDSSGELRNPKRGLIARLYEDVFSEIVGVLTSTYGSGPPDPEDVAQRAFANLSARDDLEDIEDVKNYVWVAARNLMLTEIRALGVRSKYAGQLTQDSFVEECDEIDAERVFMAREELEIVSQTIASMPERRRDIFLAKRVDGLSAEAAGRKFGVSRSSAVRHIAIATEQLTKAFARGKS